MKLLFIIFLLGSIVCNAQIEGDSLFTFGKKDTVFIKNVGDYQEGKVNVLVSPSGRKSVVTLVESKFDWIRGGKNMAVDGIGGKIVFQIETDTIPGGGPEGVNPYIETAIFENSVVIFCLYEYRVGKEIFIDTLAVDYYRKSVFLNPINYNLIITKKDLEFQKIIARKLNEKE